MRRFAMQTRRARPNPGETARTDVERQLKQLLESMRKLVPNVVANLAAGLSDAELMSLETNLGVPVPASLRALWRMHGGQLEEQDGLWEGLDLVLGVETERCNKLLAQRRSSDDDLGAAGFLEDEIEDFRFVVFGNMDHEYLLAHVRSGRIFAWFDNEPGPPSLIAYSLPSMLDSMHASIAAGEYTVEEGFGEKYLRHPKWRWERAWVEREPEPKREPLAPASEGTQDLDTTRRKIRAIEIKTYRRLGKSDDEIVALLVDDGESLEFVRGVLASLTRA